MGCGSVAWLLFIAFDVGISGDLILIVVLYCINSVGALVLG